MNADRQSGLRSLVVLIVLSLCLTSTVMAQTQEPAKPTSEVEQLKQRLQQLEQIVSDLKGQITAIEDARAKTPAPAAIVDATYTTPVTTPAPVVPEKNQDNSKGESTFTI